MNRRQFIRMLASSMAALGLAPLNSFAQNYIPVRREAHSDAAKSAVADYRRAVGLMQACPVWDPRSWWFQASIHWVPGNDEHGCSDRACLDRTFSTDGVTDPNVLKQIRAMERLARGGMVQDRGGLAFDSVWAKCPHGKLDFLPWHRLYIWYFERIVQSVLGKNDFALPYWNYLDEDKRNLPPAFRNPILPDGSINYLYFPDRSPLALEANPDPDNALLQDRHLQWAVARDQQHFERGEIIQSKNGTFEVGLGFTKQLEQSPHSTVHGRIGTQGGIDPGHPPGGMNNQAFAARDPIFYLHHAQIDRLWEFWRRRDSGRDLSDVWSNEPYVFVLADGRAEGYPACAEPGSPIHCIFTKMVGQFYDYDTLTPTTGEATVASEDQATPRQLAIGAEAEIVDTVPAEIKLTPIDEALIAETPVSKADNSFFLSLDIEQGIKSAGVNFDVFIDTQKTPATHPVAAFSVFMDPESPTQMMTGPEPSRKPAAPSEPHLMGRRVFLDVTEGVRLALEHGANLKELIVRVVPSGPVPKNAFIIERTTLIAR